MKKRLIALLACAAMLFALCAGCSTSQSQDTNPPAGNSTPPVEQDGDVGEPAANDNVQGVTDTEIIVGNTATTAGTYASVGIPFNAGLNAALKEYNDAGGFQGKSIRLINYNDDFDAANGMTYTQKLVEDDKVFALVGHFGTPTVGATLDYIKEKGIPMVYAATGINGLYNENATGADAVVFSVQPIYNTEGGVLLARALASTENNMGLGGTKVGVIASTADDGEGLKSGVELQAKAMNVDITYQDVDPAATDYSAAVNVLKNAGCDVVIICSNQGPLAKVMNAMRDANYNAKCITTYANASVGTMGPLVADGSITADRPLYATSWLDTSTEEGMADYMAFAAVQGAWEAENGIEAEDSFVLNSYAMAGYIAGQVFIAGLKNLDEQGLDLTWANYVKSMEIEVKIPMGGSVDFRNGSRVGIEDLSLNTITLEADADGNYALVTVSPITTLDEVLSHVG